MSVIVSTLGEVELGVELGWNYMKFHPNSTPNSTLCKPLIIRAVTPMRWKGGITNDKKYFSGNSVEKVVTTQVGLSYSPMHNFPRCNQRE